jgi:hypothetical protein
MDPATTAGLGWLLLACAVLVRVITAVVLAAIIVCGAGPRSKRALAVMRELTRMDAALRKAPPPTSLGAP